MTRQETFNIVWAGAKAQGFERSLDADGIACMYRGENGKRCNAGFLIPDEVYHRGMEHAGIQWVIARGSFAFPHDLTFIWQLQAAHDNARTAEEHERGLRALALTNGLSIPE